MSYVALPYLLKFLWAPLVDRYPLPLLGRRRGWMLAMQAALRRHHRAVCAAEPGAGAGADHRLCGGHRIFLGDAGHRLRCLSYRCVAAERARDFARGRRCQPRLPLGRSGSPRLCALIVADHFGWRPAFLSRWPSPSLLLVGVATACAHCPELRSNSSPALRFAARIGGDAACRRKLLGTASERGDAGYRLVVLLFKVGDAFRQQAVHAVHAGHRVLERPKSGSS